MREVEEIVSERARGKAVIRRRGDGTFEVVVLRWLDDVDENGEKIRYLSEVPGPVVITDTLEAARASARESLRNLSPAS